MDTKEVYKIDNDSDLKKYILRKIKSWISMSRPEYQLPCDGIIESTIVEIIFAVRITTNNIKIKEYNESNRIMERELESEYTYDSHNNKFFNGTLL